MNIVSACCEVRRSEMSKNVRRKLSCLIDKLMGNGIFPKEKIFYINGKTGILSSNNI